MPIDYAAVERAGGIGKGRPAALLRDDRRKKRVSLDERESEKVKARSGGQCEIAEVGQPRCRKRAFHVHHMLSGIGVRGRGESAKAIRKQHTCPDHHDLITGKKLFRLGGELPHYTNWYRRVK